MLAEGVRECQRARRTREAEMASKTAMFMGCYSGLSVAHGLARAGSRENRRMLHKAALWSDFCMGDVRLSCHSSLLLCFAKVPELSRFFGIVIFMYLKECT